MTDMDFATNDPVEWLTQGDRAADWNFREALREHRYTHAADGLLAHLRHTEHVRAGLVLEGGPVFGTGPAPDVDVAYETVRLAIGGLR